MSAALRGSTPPNAMVFTRTWTATGTPSDSAPNHRRAERERDDIRPAAGPEGARQPAAARGRLAYGDYEEALACLAADPEDEWTPERLEEALQPVLDEEEGGLSFGPQARSANLTRVRPSGERRWAVEHTLVGQQGPSPWRLQAEMDLREPEAVDGPLLRLRAIAE